MRIMEEVADIDYTATHQFFKNRAEKFRPDNPYSVTMYQDDDADLVRERNHREVEKLYPMLKLEGKSKVLDVACGIGRWADAIEDDVLEYCGVDFSDELIEIANKRNQKKNYHFYAGAAYRIEEVLAEHSCGRYNVILMIGILMYLNDRDLLSTLEQIERVSEEHATICVREPIGIRDRLTLKDFYSEELKDNYNAIYRTREELFGVFDAALLEKGFRIREEGFMFDDEQLNNRKETAQYYFILERQRICIKKK